MSEENSVLAQISGLARLRKPPGCDVLSEELSAVTEVLRGLSAGVRPTDRRGMPGGLALLEPNTPTLIIPDLHGRRDFFLRALSLPLLQGRSFLDFLEEGRAAVVCVGDAFHGEAPVRERWEEAYKEYLDGFRKPKAMNAEMNDNLRLLEMIMLVKRSYPERFFFLKGNHENIANELGEGNYPFRKFVLEGEMVKRWTEDFLGADCFRLLYEYEKLLPLAVRGDGFLITHAEPSRAFREEELINAYDDDDVLYGLTWTDNGEAEEGSVEATLENFFPGRPGTVCFGGHRPVGALYDLRGGERYVQINHPVAQIVAFVRRGEDFSPEEQIIRIDKRKSAKAR
jgi:Calcineurin-like phosphoesterase